MTTNIESTNIDLKPSFGSKIKNGVQSNIWIRILAEALSSFFFVFTINVVISLGESKVGLFSFFFKYNIGGGIWIGFLSMISFYWFQVSGISSNFINLVICHRRGQVNNKELTISVPAQFVGGLLGAIMVYFVAVKAIVPDDQSIHAMGGAMTKIKGLVNTNVTEEQLSIINPWVSRNFATEFVGTSKVGYVYLYGIVQGLINAIWIIVAFILNSIVDEKTNNKTKQFILRYIILIVGISIATIFYANTSNWVRLLTPALVNVFTGRYEEAVLVMNATFLFIIMQMIGIAIVYFEVLWKDSIGERIKQERKNSQAELKEGE